jgi:hypothetical protein
MNHDKNVSENSKDLLHLARTHHAKPERLKNHREAYLPRASHHTLSEDAPSSDNTSRFAIKKSQITSQNPVTSLRQLMRKQFQVNFSLSIVCIFVVPLSTLDLSHHVKKAIHNALKTVYTVYNANSSLIPLSLYPEL